MTFYIMTLFPDMIDAVMSESIIGRAIENGLLSVRTYNIRDYAFNKHSRVDDYPYGGGAGMLMQAEPVWQTYQAILRDSGKDSLPVVYLSPKGQIFDQEKARSYAACDDLVLLCGHYEGIDERILEEIVTEEISIGDFVLTGGEIPAMAVVDTVARLLPGVLHNDESAETESFSDGLLEYPQYTRPEVWHDKRVPEILLSGHHANVEKWRHMEALKVTAAKRPDLLDSVSLTSEEAEAVADILQS